MRNLTITRTKSFVGCLGTMKVYIEDVMGGKLNINGFPCRKLGKLKNGATVTFEIPDTATRIYVIADRLSVSFCNEFYPIPAGTEDIVLTGKNHYNPANGHAFLFDGVTDEAVLANRKKSSHKGLIVLIVALIIGFAIGFASTSGIFDGPAETKAFREEGLSITLTDDFIPQKLEGYTLCYGSPKVAVFALEEPFSLAAELADMTLDEYGELLLQANAVDSELQKTEYGTPYFTYNFTNPQTNETYTYYTFTYQGETAFWLVQFIVLTENVAEYQDDIFDWARTVEILN